LHVQIKRERRIESFDSLPLVVDSDFRSYCRSFCRDRASAGAGSWNVGCGMWDVGWDDLGLEPGLW